MLTIIARYSEWVLCVITFLKTTTMTDTFRWFNSSFLFIKHLKLWIKDKLNIYSMNNLSTSAADVTYEGQTNIEKFTDQNWTKKINIYISIYKYIYLQSLYNHVAQQRFTVAYPQLQIHNFYSHFIQFIQSTAIFFLTYSSNAHSWGSCRLATPVPATVGGFDKVRHENATISSSYNTLQLTVTHVVIIKSPLRCFGRQMAVKSLRDQDKPFLLAASAQTVFFSFFASHNIENMNIFQTGNLNFSS